MGGAPYLLLPLVAAGLAAFEGGARPSGSPVMVSTGTVWPWGRLAGSCHCSPVQCGVQ
jgi:hypothetical protein